MPSHDTKTKSETILFFAISLGVLVSTLQIFPGNVVLTDPFHQGEFLATAVALLADAVHPFHRVTIHGAADFIPALFAERQWGGDRYFLPTIAVYKVLDFLAAVLLAAIAYGLVKEKSHRWLLLLAVAAAAPLMVGYRDLVLLTSLFLFLQIIGRDVRRGWGILLLALFGASVAFGMFWSYDRGIAGALSLGAAVLVLVYTDRWFAISLMSFLAAFLGLCLFFDVFSIAGYLAVMSVLIETSGQWGYGWMTIPVLLTAFALSFNFTAISLLVRESLQSQIRAGKLSVGLCFGFLALFMLKIGTNRADLPHIYFASWIPVLAFLFLYEKVVLTRAGAVIFVGSVFLAAAALSISLKSYGLALVAAIPVFTVLRFGSEAVDKARRMCFGLLVAGCLGFISYGAVASHSAGEYAWLKSIPSPASNRSSATDGVVWASDRLKERAVGCVFDLSNNGVISGLVGRPGCSRFAYPVYAGPQHESVLISDLRDASPAAIVYSSTHWAYSIDGRDMKKRFPELDEYIQKHYPNQECGHGYCVRYKDSVQGQPARNL